MDNPAGRIMINSAEYFRKKTVRRRPEYSRIQKKNGKKNKKSGLVVAHARRHATHTAHAARRHSLGPG